jgi:hypothetical protein
MRRSAGFGLYAVRIKGRRIPHAGAWHGKIS